MPNPVSNLFYEWNDFLRHGEQEKQISSVKNMEEDVSLIQEAPSSFR